MQHRVLKSCKQWVSSLELFEPLLSTWELRCQKCISNSDVLVDILTHYKYLFQFVIFVMWFEQGSEWWRRLSPSGDVVSLTQIS
jgi:hypothetical protein